MRDVDNLQQVVGKTQRKVSQKKWRRAGFGREGERSSYSLPRLFSSVPHFALLSSIHYAWNRLVHSGPESFFQCRCKGSIDVHLGAFDIFKSSYSSCNYSCFSISKTPLFFLFSILLQKKVFGDLFLMMVFHRRSKRVKMFSETFVTMYLYKRDSNTSERTCIHNCLKEKTRKKKKVF